VDWVLGLTLIAAGIVAGFLPFIQGWMLILAGLAVLSSHSRLARTALDRLKSAGRGLRRKTRNRSADR
jgi:hypothetical protein